MMGEFIPHAEHGGFLHPYPKVNPRELEDLLYEHPAVKEVAVTGKPDDFAGEIPKAFIILKNGVTPTEAEIVRFVEGKVASYKRIREVEFRKALPKSAVGKILRRVLRDEEREKHVSTQSRRT